jgi:hypothetical protein
MPATISQQFSAKLGGLLKREKIYFNKTTIGGHQ